MRRPGFESPLVHHLSKGLEHTFERAPHEFSPSTVLESRHETGQGFGEILGERSLDAQMGSPVRSLPPTRVQARDGEIRFLQVSCRLETKPPRAPLGSLGTNEASRTQLWQQ